MNNILDIILKLPGITSVALDTSSRVPELYSVRDVIFHLQMSYYWLKSANIEFKKFSDSVVLEEGEDEEKFFEAPAIPDIIEQFKYMTKELTELSDNTYSYYNEISLPEPIKHRIEQAYNNMMTALFNVELSTLYYGQLTGIRG